MGHAKIRVTKWIAKRVPSKILYRTLIRMSTIPKQTIFQEAFAAADPSRTALDIGTNRGIVSYFMSKRFAAVHSFEPNAELCAFLEKVLPANCTLHRCALSDEAGQSALSVALESGIPIHGRGRILAEEKASRPAGAGPSANEPAYAVQAIKLETLDAQALKNIGFIKIDVEGHEEKVIRGGLATLRDNRPVLVVEIEKRHTGRPAGDTIRLIESLGYAGYFFENGKRRPSSEYRETMQDPGYPAYINDFMFLPK
jgi:FkbM family methyltransferase